MGLLSLFAKPAADLLPLPRGSFTVDSEGRVLANVPFSDALTFTT